jgi:hypothetical protein
MNVDAENGTKEAEISILCYTETLRRGSGVGSRCMTKHGSIIIFFLVVTNLLTAILKVFLCLIKPVCFGTITNH